jgi:hypothetical protein
MSVHRPQIKFLKGIILFAGACFLDHILDGMDGIDKIEKSITGYLSFLPGTLPNLIAILLFGLPANLSILFGWISGGYRIVTFPHVLERWE